MIQAEKIFQQQKNHSRTSTPNARTYTCPLCNKNWSTVEGVVACVNICGSQQTAYLEEQKHAEHINLIISNIKRSEEITKAMKEDFKKAYPISYQRIFGE